LSLAVHARPITAGHAHLLAALMMANGMAASLIEDSLARDRLNQAACLA
jgi:hypothetical protein